MERLMKAQPVGGTNTIEMMRSRRVLEINPDHSIIRTWDAACKKNPNDEEALRDIDLLYDTALVTSGFTAESPAQLGGKIYEMMTLALANKWETPDSEFIQHPTTNTPSSSSGAPEAEIVEPEEAQIVEPTQAGSQK